VAEADALAQLNRPGEAIGVYRNAFRSGAPDAVVAPKIERAQALRRSLLDICQRGEGPSAESACQAAWLPGAPDEVSVFKRRGLLLQNDARLAAALEAYVTAARLSPRDRGVARAILALTGDTDRIDAATLSARGGALLTLGRPAEAVATLRQALRLAPDSPEAQAGLRLAQRATPPNGPAANEAPDPPALPADAGNRLGNAFSNDAPVTRSN
jgi:tetratricopeptide (TPR) repeat protein